MLERIAKPYYHWVIDTQIFEKNSKDSDSNCRGDYLPISSSRGLGDICAF